MILIADISAEVCERYSLPPLALIARDRRAVLARPRMIAMFLARKLTRHSLAYIGRWFGRDHSTVAHAVARIEQLCIADVALVAQLVVLASRIGSRRRLVAP